jgi:hypothetical protein
LARACNIRGCVCDSWGDGFCSSDEVGKEWSSLTRAARDAPISRALYLGSFKEVDLDCGGCRDEPPRA